MEITREQVIRDRKVNQLRDAAIKKMNLVFDRGTLATCLINLYTRWLDEQEYEDIEDYKTVLARVASKEGLNVERMTKRPFGFYTTIAQCKIHVTVKLSGRSNVVISYVIKEIKIK